MTDGQSSRRAASARLLRRGPSLSEQAYRRLKTLFMLGEMAPGKRLTYRAVADDLGISVTPAREALFRLAAERIFDHGPAGVIVVPTLTAPACQELWRIRLLLEGECAALATAHATPALIKEAERAHMLMAQAKQARRLRDAMRHNLDFHFALYRAACSPILLALIEDVWARSAAYVRLFHGHHVEKRTGAAMQGPHMHATIIAALRAGDAARVRAGIERDLLEVRDGILSVLQGLDAEERSKRPAKMAAKAARAPARRAARA